ncbi:hypothetical protein A167_00695 [Alcanivorax sp. S71-1-4]|uniref:host nuclease inhibitor protein n=1 Tax=Alcanivorax sp. S71-1-4 TaxID=1177159 RepID=UPI00135A993D|nr:host nuclease inhibitor protein [Alcanivorax sp. S71-1-4]KAF0810415.1 hypothetical protein A167_00695 [Alcanivorax sp. S71-1-4]
MTTKRRVHAYCWRSGRIEIGDRVPEGANHIASGQEDMVRQQIQGTARLAYDNKTFLVPGVPEASTEDEAITALCRYVQWLGQRNQPGFRAIGA